MRRRLLNFLTGVSLLLCVAVVALWVRGHRHYDLAGLRLGPVGVGAASYRGQFLWVGVTGLAEHSVESNYETGPASPQIDAFVQFLRRTAAWNAFGFSYLTIDVSTQPLHALVTPAWSVALLAAALPAVRLARHRTRRRRAAKGTCPKCGYDLRATPDRCPECGKQMQNAE